MVAVIARAGDDDGDGHGIDFLERGRGADELFFAEDGRRDGVGRLWGEYGSVSSLSLFLSSINVTAGAFRGRELMPEFRRCHLSSDC